jgi:hypothetical protein
MPVDPLAEETWGLTDRTYPVWQADLAALRDLLRRQHDFHLELGDLFNELKSRWGKRMRQLAREAGVPYELARRHALVARAIPPGTPLRTLGLPFAILRLLAPLAEKERWAEQANSMQETGRLQVRDFARLLEGEGLRKRRVRKRPTCLQCGRPVPEHPASIYFRGEWGDGWFCRDVCAATYFEQRIPATPAPLVDSDPESGESESPNRGLENGESESQKLLRRFPCRAGRPRPGIPRLGMAASLPWFRPASRLCGPPAGISSRLRGPPSGIGLTP